MDSIPTCWLRLRWGLARGVGIFFIFQASSFAVTVFDSSQLGQNLPVITGQTSGSTTTSCTYVATDTYVGPNSASGYGPGPYSTESIGSGGNGMGGGQISQPAPPLTDASNNLSLAFRGGSWSSNFWANGHWDSSTTSPVSTPVPCTGTYQVYFTLQLQPTYYGGNQIPPQTAPTITVYPCVQTTDGLTLVYGSLLVGGVCPTTGPSFTFNPVCNGGNYCSVVTFPFATQVHLNANQVIGPPSLHASAQLTVTGGEFSVYYVGP